MNEHEKQQSRKSWALLLPPASTSASLPDCTRHHEPCVRRTVTTRGANYRRPFFACARAPAPEGDPSGGCGFFAWESEWQAKRLAQPPP
jgi:hypothetical protein